MYFRNTKDLISTEGVEVEAGSLWKLKVEDIWNLQGIMVLEDEDQYVTHPRTADFENV